ncbi:MAG: hypothetical protein IPN68_13705 [Bacteroidetes bacterium]|nr:hypothetical protein [Bacteroidota bacterium]
MKETIENITRSISENIFPDITVFDESFIYRSISNRINELSVKSISDYLPYLNTNRSEQQILIETLFNSYSEFFRNPLTFLIIEQILLPKIFLQKSRTYPDEIRIWSAGCSAGQEPYSIAILTEDYKANNHQKINVRIFATDKNKKELLSAGKGIYHFKSVQNARLYHISNYFTNNGEYYSINDKIKKCIDFSILDLLDEGAGAPPSSIYGDFDIVMCSNLLFYYKPEIQKKILTRLSNSLVPGGFLIAGEAETGIIKSIKGFRQFTATAAIFMKT